MIHNIDKYGSFEIKDLIHELTEVNKEIKKMIAEEEKRKNSPLYKVLAKHYEFKDIQSD